MTLFAVYDKATGDLYSTGTVVGDPDDLAERGLVAKQFADLDAHPENEVWNPKAKAFRPMTAAEIAERIPPEAPLDRLAADDEYAALGPAERALVEKFVRLAVGDTPTRPA